MANAAVSQSPKSAPASPPAAPPTPEPDAPEVEADSEPAPVVETVNMAGLVLERTIHPDGECETKVLKEPMIAEELVRATRASQRRHGR